MRYLQPINPDQVLKLLQGRRFSASPNTVSRMCKRYQGTVQYTKRYMDHSRVRTQQQDSCVLLYVRKNRITVVRALQASHRLCAWFYMARGLKHLNVWRHAT